LPLLALTKWPVLAAIGHLCLSLKNHPENSEEIYCDVFNGKCIKPNFGRSCFGNATEAAWVGIKFGIRINSTMSAAFSWWDTHGKCLV
jgi:hypothetical protein